MRKTEWENIYSKCFFQKKYILVEVLFSKN